ncbi:unnamed protein product [Eretmochelys imbricata]
MCAGGIRGCGGRFLPEEWAALADWQRELYWAVRKENYELVTSLGSDDGRLGCSESPSRALCRGWSVCLGSSGLQGPPALGTGVRDAERPATSAGKGRGAGARDRCARPGRCSWQCPELVAPRAPPPHVALETQAEPSSRPVSGCLDSPSQSTVPAAGSFCHAGQPVVRLGLPLPGHLLSA